ncbi:helix-turn-helix domain-containing protein [Mycolicibacterium neoaurum]|uniref:helix-turn-helix domain-containing protein n=1 Tax=Mycolicibacterium neoaurum TaxID=1795 RepID=UPI001F4CA94F|nr:helix-turn-helix domain-containing protein [Mycolicibacterium neoaurum]
MLAFDLDAKVPGGSAAVAADRARLTFWLSGYGARFISDHSTSGGVHVIVPLARVITFAQLEPFMRAAAKLFPTLDVKPMLNPLQGCLTVPGSATREGGYRLLDGDIDAAIAVLTERNYPELFDDLFDSIVTPQLLLASPRSPDGLPHGSAVFSAPTDCFEGDGGDTRLLATYRRTTPMPQAARRFAEDGTIPADKRSSSEARQAVLSHACWLGYSLNDVRSLMTQGNWVGGLGKAYQRYKEHQVEPALHRDWNEAQRWVAWRVQKVRTHTHRKLELHTGGTRTPPPGLLLPQRQWLAHAIFWCDIRFRSDSGRWMKAAVLQALASGAAKTGEVVNGTPVVRVGGRSLSIGAGLVSKESVWAVLRELRDIPGSPIVLVASASGKRADGYALVLPDIRDPDPNGPGRPALTDVHPVWSVLGLRYRRVYEVLCEAIGGLNVGDLASSARMARTSTYDAVNELARVGLVVRRRGYVSLTELTLDQLGEQLGVFNDRAARIAEYQANRAAWHEWLASRGTRPTRHVWTKQPPHPRVVWAPLRVTEEADYLAVQLRTGPPAVSV